MDNSLAVFPEGSMSYSGIGLSVFSEYLYEFFNAVEMGSKISGIYGYTMAHKYAEKRESLDEIMACNVDLILWVVLVNIIDD